MKSQREIYAALLAGETLTNYKFLKVKLENDALVSVEKLKPFTEQPNFSRPKLWQIYKEPKWYENIPSVGGVLCHVCEQEDWDEFEDTPRIITEHKNNAFYDSDGLSWPYAKPLPKKMIQVLAYNAPDEAADG